MNDILRWTPLSSAFGARVEADPAVLATNAGLAAWRDLFASRHLLVLHIANLAEADQRALTGALGVLSAEYGVDDEGMPVPHFISNSSAKGSLGTTEIAYHADLSFCPVQPGAISLYGLEVVDGTSSTRWISAIDGYAALPAPMRDRLKGLQVLNVISNTRCERNRFNRQEPDIPATVRQLVQLSEAGTPFLTANEAQSDHLVGLPAQESDALLDEIFAYLYRPEAVVEHVWNKGDLVVWDNRVLQHARGDVSGVGERTLRRFECSELGLRDQFPEFYEMIRSSYGKGVLPEPAS